MKRALQFEAVIGWIMKRWIRVAALAVLVALVVLVGRRGYQDYVVAREVAEREKTINWLDSFVIPKVDFREASLEEAAAILNRTIAAAPGHTKDLHIEIASAKETAAAFRRRLEGVNRQMPPPGGTESPPPMPIEPVSEESNGQKITIGLTDVPVRVALQYLAGLSNRLIETRGRVIRLHDVHGARGTCDPIVTKTFRLFERQFNGLADSVQTARKQYGIRDEPEGDVVDVRPIWWTGSGLPIYEGDSFKLDRKTRDLTVRSTQTNIDMISNFIWSEPTITERVISWMESLFPTLPSASPPPAAPNNGLPPPPPDVEIPGL